MVKVMDLQNVSATLIDQVAQSIVFSAYLRKFSPLIHRTTKRTFPVTMKKVSVPRIATEDNVDGFENREDITPDRGTPVVPIIAQLLEVFPPQARKNA